MFFKGDPVKAIGQIDTEKIRELYNAVFEKFNDKWIKRSFALMNESYCLKAITPSNFDTLSSREDEEQLRDLLIPFIAPYVSENEILVYLDVSSLPPESKCKVHLDFSLFHVLSRRIHIPISTNPNARFSLLSETGPKNYNLKVGSVYEINNTVLHVVSNTGDSHRWHIIADVIDKSLYNYLTTENKLTDWGFHPSINNCINPKVVANLELSLETDPIDI
jgi:hypothetical protein